MNFSTELQDYASSGKRLSVLVVDDSAAVRSAIRQVLELVSIQILEAASGKDALQSIYDQAPDLVVLDVDMSGMSGMSILKTIRNTYDKMTLPVIMVTPNDSSVEVVRALDLGANDFISKPLDFDILWARISNQLIQKQAAEYMQSARQQLEQQVRQRTAELDAINDRLTNEIRERTRAQARLKRQANYDQLTSLPNRHLALDRLKQVICKAQRQGVFPCVAYLDLDNFKFVNDTLGHAAGDEMLREAAARLSACARKSDTVARLGGDEFLMILDDDGNEPEDMREHAVSKVGDRLLQSFDKPFELEGKEIKISPSIGFAIFGKDGEDGETLMRHADISMYRAKKQGKNNYCFYSPEMMAKTRIRQFVETHLHHAFQQGQLGVHYQPITGTDGGEARLLCASLCWNNNDMGYISPEVFMPVAEDTGLIVQIGEWMIDTVCEQVAVWKRRSLGPVNVILPLGNRQLHDAELAPIVRRAITTHGLNGDELLFMLSEDLVSQENNSELVRSLQATGVGLVLGQYGTGQNSIASLQRYRFACVMTDQGCVHDIQANDRNREMIKALNACCVALDMPLVVSGVDHAEDLACLDDLGCRLVQGAGIASPASAVAIERWLSKSGKNARLKLVRGQEAG